MKKVLFLCSFLILTACQKDALTFQSEGVITQRDVRKCYCCGGWFIEIEGNTWLADLTAEQTEALGLDETALPVPVQLDWEKPEKPCLANKIIVTRIQRKPK